MASEDKIDYTGLKTKDYNVLLQELKDNLNEIYAADGDEINFDSSSPDGQFANIITEMGVVLRDIITEVYNSCSPSNVSGAVQDIRYQINNLYRKGGTFTIQNIDVTVDRTVSLAGLDDDYNSTDASSFTVADSTGNQYFLIDSATLTTGTHSLPFRAKEIGIVLPTVNTITNINTITAGVVSVNNSVGATSIGEEQETDEEFRLRRERSVCQASQNNIDTIYGKLLELDGVTDLNIHLNNTNATDSTNTPAHTLWAIINGGANTDIADIIYANISGSDTRGNVVNTVYSVANQPLTIRFDRPTAIPLYVKLNIKTTGDEDDLNIEGIKTDIVSDLTYKIGQDASTAEVTANAQDALSANGGYKKAYVTDVYIAKIAASATATATSSSITSCTCDAEKFSQQIQTSGTYTFSYNGVWKLGSTVVQLADYGVTFTGTAAAGDVINVYYTQNGWTEFVSVATKADLFTLDTSRIYITVEEV